MNNGVRRQELKVSDLDFDCFPAQFATGCSIFAGNPPSKHLSERSAQHIFEQVLQKADIDIRFKHW